VVPSPWQATWTVYILIVIWEFLTAFVLLGAAVAWLRVLAGRLALDSAVRLASIGWTMAVLQFLGGFLTIGEWFRMWAKTETNATSAALQNFLVAAVGLNLVHLPARATGPIVMHAFALDYGPGSTREPRFARAG
jgi:predicted small integral membrane protein